MSAEQTVETPSTTSPESTSLGPGAAPPASAPVGHAGIRIDVAERQAMVLNGFLGLLLALLAVVAGAALFFNALPKGHSALAGAGAVLACSSLFLLTTLTVIQPGQTTVIQFFGRYIGTERRAGLFMLIPLCKQRKVSVRVNNFETSELKVNDYDGNPIEIAAIVVWQVADTAKAVFAVEDYRNFIRVQSEAALRHVATSHPYDDPKGAGTSLRGSTDVVSAELAHEVAQRVAVAGLEIVEVRISHLAYAPEIAGAMLQRQQAGAVVAARSQIVEGAVGMVELALAQLEEEDIVVLDDERKAAMVSNLLVVLCAEQKATPILNAGSLYS
ncbi:SPFH domain-containing protein [Austwickia chelonae]|uniref:SPFH domain-containing protein n=1 Tax=Austwickia chelonae TaxID=100225 RepID=UPI000E242AE6|nr:SPFH domain-containing protein [Austwickia chelonae]